MPLGSKAELVKCIEASKVLSEEKLADAVKKSSSNSAKDFAVYLVKKRLLTSWQAKFLLTGRSNLRLDNYILTNRITQDELGDRFEARHESLDRPVILQLLPKTVSSDSALREFFVAHVGRIAEVDHPYLVDVHDVDEHTSRFFVVTEFLDGVSLVETVMDSRSLVRCTNQILQGIGFAQSHGILHGEISESNIFALDNGDFKIVGSGVSVLRRKLKGENLPLPQEDFVAFSKVLKSRFEFLPDDEQREYAWLKSLLGELESNPLDTYQNAIQKTSEVMATWTMPNIPVLAETEAVPASQAAQPATVANVGSPVPSRTSKASNSPSHSEGSSSDINSDQGATPWYKLPGMISAISCGALALLVGGLWLGGAFSGSKDKQVAEKTNEASTSKASNTSIASNKNVENNYRPSREKFDPKNADIHAALRRAQGLPDEEEGVKTESPNSKTTHSSNPETPKGNRLPEPVPAPPPVAPQPNISPKPEPKPEPETEPEPKAVNPLSSLADIDFPLSENKQEFIVGELVAEPESLNLKIISSPICFKTGKGEIELQNVDVETWDTLFKARSSSDPTVVGQFKFVAPNLTFTWAEEVAAKSKANFIRNCLLSVSANGQNKTISLRQPTEISAISLTEAKYNSKVTAAAKFPPNASAIRIEVGKPPSWPDAFLEQGPMDSIHEFDEQFSALPIYFAQDTPHQYLSVVFQPIVKSKIQFALSVFARGMDTDAVQLNSHEDAVGLFNDLQGAREVAFQQKQQAEILKANAPRGQKKQTGEFAKQAANHFEAIGENTTIAGEIRDLLSNRLHGGEFPVTVYYELDGRRVIIAKTAAVTE